MRTKMVNIVKMKGCRLSIIVDVHFKGLCPVSFITVRFEEVM